MGEKNLWSKVGLIVLLVGMCAWQLYPPTERLKWGIDLAGGHSLLFEIDDSGLSAAEKDGLAERMMNILKNRVDPQGTRNLIWRPIGRNRLEIQMPTAGEKQKGKRESYEKARDALIATNITEMQIRTALSLLPAQRDKLFDQMIGRYESRGQLFNELAGAEEEYKRLSADWDKLEPAATTQPAGTELAKKVDDARIKRDETIRSLLDTNIQTQVLIDLLELGKHNEVRVEEVQKLKEAHPALREMIDNLSVAYDEYADVKGALDDPSDLMRLLRGAGVLEFRILATRDPNNLGMIDSSNPAYNEPVKQYEDNLDKYGPRKQGNDNFQWFKISQPDARDWPETYYITGEYAGGKYVLAHATEDMGLLHGMGWTLSSARPDRDEMGRLAIAFQLAGKGPKLFSQLTGNNIGKPLCIFLDGEAISAANIRSTIYDSGQISGNFTEEYVSYVVQTLEAGTLPARLKENPLQQKSIGSTLGETNKNMGLHAIVVAFALTIAFMLVYYTYSGFVADIAVLMNLVVTLGVMSFLQATFTLPGIAGLVLTLGMAVDANVLIYERIREELQRGISIRMAVKLGYEKAFSAILDSNVTTILTAVILGSLGSEEIKGFGLTLGIGLCTSMFTALFVTRQFFHIMLPNTLNKEEVGRAWLGTAGLILVGAVIMGLGRAFVSPQERGDSALCGLGDFFTWLASTAVVLMACLWIFRFFYHKLGHQKANRLPMLKLFSAPKINWMNKYRIFWVISAAIIVAGLVFESAVDKSQYLDIEFLGGTSVQIQLKKEHENMTDKDVEQFVFAENRQPPSAVDWLRSCADELDGATVVAGDEGSYTISTARKLTELQLEALLMPAFEEYVGLGGVAPADNGITVQLKPGTEKQPQPNLARVKELVAEAANYARKAANNLRSTRVQTVRAPGEASAEKSDKEQELKSFELITPESRRTLVAEALIATMGDILEVTKPIEATLVMNADRTPEDGIFPVPQSANQLKDAIGGESTQPIENFKGGVAMVFDDLDPPQTTGQIESRLKLMRLQPDFEEYGTRPYKAIGIEPVKPTTLPDENTLYKRIAIVASDPNLVYVEGEDNAAWTAELANRELTLAQAALASSRSLQRVTKFDAQVASEATTKAVIAIILSLLAIAGYLWVRFGSVQFGVAGIIALFHDVAITLSCVMACHHLYDTPIGQFLGLQDFRIDLAMIAAFLTIVGYSINDTIVIFDRIRENRGRLATISPTLINSSINQTLSRTLITSWTTFMVVLVMYIVGGAGIHGFAFAMIVGSISGVYSTVAIATPMLNHPRVMWTVAIALAGVVLVAMVSQIGNDTVRYAFMAIVVVLVLIGIARQLTGLGQGPVRQSASA